MKISAMLTTISVLSLGFANVDAAERPVVVELFTSQGCSSCPPADLFLTELVRNRPDVLALAFHVTYWNELGWADPFSLESATQRQSRYGERFGDGSYTPEIVVDGRKDIPGSSRSQVDAAIEAAERENATLATISVRSTTDGLSIDVGAGTGSAELLLIGFDEKHQTNVGRGENGGRTLPESNIVRSVTPLGQWRGNPISIVVHVPEGDDVAAILQTAAGAIVGAARRTAQ
jgi:hypothetical protein